MNFILKLLQSQIAKQKRLAINNTSSNFPQHTSIATQNINPVSNKLLLHRPSRSIGIQIPFFTWIRINFTKIHSINSSGINSNFKTFNLLTPLHVRRFNSTGNIPQKTESNAHHSNNQTQPKKNNATILNSLSSSLTKLKTRFWNTIYEYNRNEVEKYLDKGIEDFSRRMENEANAKLDDKTNELINKATIEFKNTLKGKTLTKQKSRKSNATEIEATAKEKTTTLSESPATDSVQAQGEMHASISDDSKAQLNSNLDTSTIQTSQDSKQDDIEYKKTVNNRLSTLETKLLIDLEPTILNAINNIIKTFINGQGTMGLTEAQNNIITEVNKIKTDFINTIRNTANEEINNQKNIINAHIEATTQQFILKLVKIFKRQQNLLLILGKSEKNKGLEAKLDQAKLLRSLISESTILFGDMLDENNENNQKSITQLDKKIKDLTKWIDARSKLIAACAIFSPSILSLIFVMIIILIDSIPSIETTKNEIFDLLLEFEDLEARLETTKTAALMEEVNHSKILKYLPLIIKTRTPIFNSITQEMGELCVGGILLLHSEYEVALQAFDYIIEVNSKCIEAHYGKSFALYKLGNAKQANIWIKKTLDLLNYSTSTRDYTNAINPRILFRTLLLQAEIYNMNNQDEKAVQECEAIIKHIFGYTFEDIHKISNFADVFSEIDKNNKDNIIYALNACKLYAYYAYNKNDFKNSSTIFKFAKKLFDLFAEKQLYPVSEKVNHPLRMELKIGQILASYYKLNHDSTTIDQKDKLRKKLLNIWKNEHYITVESKLRNASAKMDIDSDVPDKGVSTDKEYALMVKHANTDNVILDDSTLIAKNWKLLAPTSLDLSETKSFKANVYFHEGRNHLVIVFLDNSSFIQNYLDEFVQTKDRHLKAISFVNKYIKSNEIKRESNQKITLSGFGYGAVIAQVVLFEVYNDLVFDNIECVTFNSAGSQLYIDAINHKNIHKIELPSHVPIVTYLTAPDTINTIGKQFATTIQLHTKFDIAHNNINRFAYMITCPGYRTPRKNHQFSEQDIIDGLDNMDKFAPLLIERWPMGLNQLDYYIYNEQKTQRQNLAVSDPSASLDNNIEPILTESYKAKKLNIKKRPLSEFSHEMRLYLNAYTHTNGKIDTNAKHSLIKFSIKDGIVTVHSHLSLIEFKRYLKDRIAIVGKENLLAHKKCYAEKGFFAERYHFFFNRATMLKDDSQIVSLSTLNNRMK